MSSVTDTRRAGPSKREWADKRAAITDLYIAKKNTLRDVMRAMEAVDFKASEQQYKIKFAEWGISKYRKGSSRETAPRQGTPNNGTTSQIAALAQPFPETEMALTGHAPRQETPSNGTTAQIAALAQPFPEAGMAPLDLTSHMPDTDFYPDHPLGNGFNIVNEWHLLQPTNLGTPTSTKLRQPIHQAAQSRNLKMVQLLLGRSPNCAGLRGTDGATPLGLAAQAGHLEVVRLLLEYVSVGVDVNAQVVDTFRTPIHQAAQQGHLEVVRLLLNSGANPDPHDNGEVTPLWSAAQQGHSEIVQLLIDAHADIEAASKDGKRRPLHQAAQNGHLVVVRKLLEAGANLEPSKDSFDDETPSPLLLAAHHGHSELATLLVRRGADVHFKIQPHRRCPLHQAANNGHADIVALLLENGADVDAREVDDWTPLMIVAQYNYVKIVDLLLRNGANVNAEEKDGATALWLASQQGQAEVVKTLLGRGAKSMATYRAKRRPIHQAAQNGHLEVIKLLLKEFPDEVDVEEKEGVTPLFLASQGDKSGHLEVAEYLLEMGARVVLP